jgi:two-component system chemotaxis sensor kinase CheA
MRLDSVKEKLQHPELSAALDTLSRLVSELQYNVMQSRLVPIGFVFSRFPRMVRDLAKQQKKELDLEMMGSDIELDRAVIDEIGESLVHLLRNAVDHGMEAPDARKKAGKSSQGTIRITAERTNSFAIIKVSDDGQGLDLEEIKSTAIKNKVLSPEATTEELIQSIFFGVSTTKKVTAVSGRGFGLNIVKNKIESLGGSVKVETEPQKGTTFIIEIPLTLAIIKALFIKVAGKTYAIPLASVERLITVNRADIKGILNYEAIVLNEEDTPITRLDILFKAPSLGLRAQPIVIVKQGEEKLGLAVDAFLTAQEIVIKPLNKLVRENKYFSGSTIIGSGEVVLILDVANLMLTKREFAFVD